MFKSHAHFICMRIEYVPTTKKKLFYFGKYQSMRN